MRWNRGGELHRLRPTSFLFEPSWCSVACVLSADPSSDGAVCPGTSLRQQEPVLFLTRYNLYSLCHYSGEWNHLDGKITPVIIQPTGIGIVSIRLKSTHPQSLAPRHTHTHTHTLRSQGHYSKPREQLLFTTLYCSHSGEKMSLHTVITCLHAAALTRTWEEDKLRK